MLDESCRSLVGLVRLRESRWSLVGLVRLSRALYGMVGLGRARWGLEGLISKSSPCPCIGLEQQTTLAIFSRLEVYGNSEHRKIILFPEYQMNCCISNILLTDKNRRKVL